MAISSCTPPASLTTINEAACKVKTGAVAYVLFQRLGHEFKAGGTTPNPIEDLASWTPLMSATDDTKVAKSPQLLGLTAPQGEATTTDDTLDGSPEVIDFPGIQAEARYADLPGDVITQIKELEKEGDGTLGVYLSTLDGRIAAFKKADGVYGPIPIRALAIGDPGIGGRGQRDEGKLNFNFKAGYRKNYTLTDVNFDVATELAV